MRGELLHRNLVGIPQGRLALNTPALVADLGALNRNIERMATFAQEHQLSLRPHVKTHKSVDIAQLQRASGAIGFCCAKIGEAEAMAEWGRTSRPPSSQHPQYGV